MVIIPKARLRAAAIIFSVLGLFVIAKAIDKKEYSDQPVTVQAADTGWQGDEWFYEGDEEASPLDSLQYSEMQSIPCGGEDTICEISAPQDPNDENLPDLNATVPNSNGQTVREQIQEALETGKINSTVKSFRNNQ